MLCKKPNRLSILLTNTLIVVVAFMGVDFIWYGLINPGPDPYMVGLGTKLLYTLVLALGYAHLYNKASRIWRPGTDESFVYKNYSTNDACKATWPKIANGLYFSMLTSIVVIMFLALSSFFLVNIYLFVFHGIRGDLESETSDSLVLAGKILVGSTGMELTGKTESDPDR